MILLSGHSLAQGRRVPVISMSLSLKERETTASLVPESMSGITTESWLLDDTNPGKGIVYRVKSIQTAYATNTPTIQLEHVIRCLDDRILFGEVTPQMMGGGETCTAKQAVQYILKKSDDWTLGRFDYNVTNAYKFEGDSLLDALEEISRTLEDCRWTYDLSVYPFKLNFIKKDNTNPCEMRPGRNLVAITKTVDKSNMYTRFYPIGKNDLHLPGNGYVQKNTGKYGIIEKTQVDTNRATEADLRAWADERLKIHAEPRVQVVVDGLELSSKTGESLDKLTLGRTCKIPLEEFSTKIEEEIVELNYRDKKNEPENVRVTMANEQEDIVKILAKEIKEGAGPNGSGRGGGGRGGARQQKEDNAWFEDTNDHVAMCARGIIGVDASGNVNWERLSRLDVDGGGIHGSVQQVQNDQVLMEGRLELTESNFDATVQSIGADGKITAASICLAINNAGSQAKISADHIILSGKTTINDILKVGDRYVTVATPMRVSGDIMAMSLTLRSGSDAQTLTETALGTTIKKAEVNGNTLKLTTYSGNVINFNKATTITQSWDSGYHSVKATADGAEDKYYNIDWRFNNSGGTYFIDMYHTASGSNQGLSGTSRQIQLGLSGDGKTVQIQNGYGVQWVNTPTYTLPEQVWSYSTYASSSDSAPTGYAKSYDLSMNHQFHTITVTVNGETKKIAFRLTN